MKNTVFYAWQSDLDPKANKSFIRKAIESAILEVNAELTIEDSERHELDLDHDTKGVPGIPEIARTIFDKIDSCGIFIADLTFVANARNFSGVEKSLPNSNVILELGYAIRAIGADRIICVINEAYGSAEKLFFDLAHRRRPIGYNWTVEQPNRDVTLKLLSTQVRNAVKAILAAGVLSSPTDAQRQERLVVEQFWGVINLFWCRFRMLLYGLGFVSPIGKHTRWVFGQHIPFLEANVQTDLVDKALINELFRNHDFTQPSSAFVSDGCLTVSIAPDGAASEGAIPWASWFLAEVKSVEAGCDKLLTRFGSVAKGEVIEQLSLMHNRAENLTLTVADFKCLSDSALHSIWMFFEHLILSTQLIERRRATYPRPI